MAKRLLILKCSARKRQSSALLPASERYDGPLWRVLRNYVANQTGSSDHLDVYALSAGYGLLAADTLLPDYDATMSPQQADALRPSVLHTFTMLMQQGYSDLCLGVSQRYVRAMRGWQDHVPTTTTVTITDGPMGAKLGQLRAWLNGYSWLPSNDYPERLVAAEQPHGTVQISGVTLRLSREEVLQRVRIALATDATGASRFRDWYVLIDGQAIAPKWLVSTISGLPTSAFDASAARRVLLALGIDVERRMGAGPAEQPGKVP